MGGKLSISTAIWNGLRKYVIDPVVKNFINGNTAPAIRPNANSETQEGCDVVENTTNNLKISGGKEAEIGCNNMKGTNSNPGISRRTINKQDGVVVENVEKFSIGCNNFN